MKLRESTSQGFAAFGVDVAVFLVRLQGLTQIPSITVSVHIQCLGTTASE